MFIFASLCSILACNPINLPGTSQSIPTILTLPATQGPPTSSAIDSTAKLPPNTLLPGMLINLSGGFARECGLGVSNQIWMFEPSTGTSNLLLGETGIDYNFPQWSPDGEFIAYIESIPGSLPDESDLVIGGTGSLWIMRSDASGKQKVGETFERIDYVRTNGSCEKYTYIPINPVWSPNSQYLIYVHLEDSLDPYRNISNYYLYYINTKVTRLISTQKRLVQVVWTADSSRFIIMDDDSLQVFTINNFDEVELELIKYPLQSPSPQRVVFGRGNAQRFAIEIQNNSLIGSFYVIDGTNREYDSLQIINLTTKEWGILNQGSQEGWGDPLVGNKWAVACGIDGAIKFINPETWEVQGSYRNPIALNSICRILQIFQDKDGKDMASFVSDIGEVYGLWSINMMANGMLGVNLLIEINSTKFPKNLTTIIDYSWQP